MNFLFVIRNFEESEDELREAVVDSMKNLFVLEDGSSDEAEEGEGGGAARTADCQHIQLEDQDSRSDATAGPPGVAPSEEGDENKTVNTQHQTS